MNMWVLVWVWVWVLIIISYLLGCFNTGYYYITYIYDLDIRKYGSGGTGATNVSRVAGKKGFIITFCGDFFKGALITTVASHYQFSVFFIQLMILSVIVGHIFPIQLGFKGGKGISTFLGCVMILNYKLALIMIVNMVVLFLLIRDFKVAGLLSIIILDLEYLCFYKTEQERFSFMVITLLIILAHRNNIKKYIFEKSHR